jgi:hypothetical protein
MATGSHFFLIDNNNQSPVRRFTVLKGYVPQEVFSVGEGGETVVSGPVVVNGGPLTAKGTNSGQAVAVFKQDGSTFFEVTQEGVGHFPNGLTIPRQAWTWPGTAVAGRHAGELNIVIIDPSYWGSMQGLPAFWLVRREFLAVWDGASWRLFHAG